MLSFSPYFRGLVQLPRGRLDDFWKFLPGPLLICRSKDGPDDLSLGPLLRKGHWCPAGGHEAVQLVQTPARIRRRVPASSPHTCASHQPGVPERHTAEVDPHVSSQSFPGGGQDPPSLACDHRKEGEP